MKYWAFDLDGTLVDSIEAFFHSLRELFGNHKVHLDEDDLKKCLTMPLIEFLTAHLPRNQVEDSYTFIKKKSLADSSQIPVFEGIQDLLQGLKKKECGLALWTAREIESTYAILKHTGLESYFDIIVTGSCITKPKPDPEGLLKIMNHYGCQAHEITMVGDHDVDIIAAKAIDVRPIRVTYKTRFQEQKKCDISYKQFFEVSDFDRWLQQI